MSDDVTPADVNRLYETLKKEAESSGYNLNPDVKFTKALIKGLLVNERRYGYRTCPCRLAANNKQEDSDITCPCDYRDPDLNQYGCCYCALYVSKEVVEGKKHVMSISERRPPKSERMAKEKPAVNTPALPIPVWRCRVCGYLCARDDPPDTCPICMAEKERFERFM